jgi:exopolyphosphatase / guanosine-5'-triphosphate,3'-diphosphate pyrophosphatase
MPLPQQYLTGEPMSQPTVATEEPITVAAIDLGSNSFHMVVAQQREGEFRILDKLKEMVRLGAGLNKEGSLTEEAQQRALACLARFGQRLREFPYGSVRIVGTKTLRSAHNAEAFLERAQEVVGHPIEVISGAEEARLIFLGVAHSLPASNELRLVIDIGGGSTEIINGTNLTPHYMESLSMGCVSFSERFFSDGVINERNWNRALIAARQRLQTVEVEFRRRGWANAWGASGTIKTVAQVVQEMGWCSEGIDRNSLNQLGRHLIAAGNTQKLALKGLREERIPVFVGGVAVLRALFDALWLERINVADWALREGLIFDQLGRLHDEDIRLTTIQGLMARFAVDQAQADRVVMTSLNLYHQLHDDWELSNEHERQLLEWGARLHEVGLAISHAAYHKHGAYLIENADLPGFSRTEQRLIALLVRNHRRKPQTETIQSVGSKSASRLEHLIIILRLAVLFNRSRTDQQLPVVIPSAKGNTLNLTFPAGWLEEHPLTLADLEEEIQLLKVMNYPLTIGS